MNAFRNPVSRWLNRVGLLLIFGNMFAGFILQWFGNSEYVRSSLFITIIIIGVVITIFGAFILPIIINLLSFRTKK